MKLKLRDSFLLLLVAIAITLIGLGLVVMGLQTEALPLSVVKAPPVGRWPLLLAGLVQLLCGAYLFSLPQQYRRRKQDFVVQQTASGELSISLKALENLVHKTVGNHPETSFKGMDIRQQKDGVTIDLRVALAGNVNIPLAVSSLQKQVKQQMLAATGVDVKEVRVTVEAADSHIKASPFLVREAPVADEAAQPHESTDETRDKP